MFGGVGAGMKGEKEGERGMRREKERERGMRVIIK